MKFNLILPTCALLIVSISLASCSTSAESNVINFGNNMLTNEEKYQLFNGSDSGSDLETVVSDQSNMRTSETASLVVANRPNNLLDRITIQIFLTIATFIFGFFLSSSLNEVFTVLLTFAFYIIGTLINYLTRNS